MGEYIVTMGCLLKPLALRSVIKQFCEYWNTKLKKCGYSKPWCVYGSCIDCQGGKCVCKQSDFCGMGLGYLPWNGCRCFPSKRRCGKDYIGRPKKKRNPKWTTMEEFEFGV